MFSALREILKDNWGWRGQIWHLAVVDIQKQVRGTVLGWFWLIAKPLIFIVTLWFALEIGLRAERTVGDYPYILWLSLGLIGWFFMSSMIGSGSNVYKAYSYLIDKMRFPLSVISSFYGLAQLIIFLFTLLLPVIVMFILKVPFTIYALQMPFLIILMYLFFVFFSIMTSPVSALSKDFHNLIKAMQTPLMWFSGIIFNVEVIEFSWFKYVMLFNPITFFVYGFRAALCDHYWVWEKPETLIAFVGVFLLTLIVALVMYKRLGKEIPDVF
ncbi:MAG: ABC transporter permease [Coriobacteriales bacterium]|jgi:teichoic acid transport system permease protein|nr:ABC transporter permease [Coriobacteriales bacterium]